MNYRIMMSMKVMRMRDKGKGMHMKRRNIRRKKPVSRQSKSWSILNWGRSWKNQSESRWRTRVVLPLLISAKERRNFLAISEPCNHIFSFEYINESNNSFGYWLSIKNLYALYNGCLCLRDTAASSDMVHVCIEFCSGKLRSLTIIILTIGLHFFFGSYGSFFGPSQPVIAQRVIQESKSLLENQHLAPKLSTSLHVVCIKNPTLGIPFYLHINLYMLISICISSFINLLGILEVVWIKAIDASYSSLMYQKYK